MKEPSQKTQRIPASRRPEPRRRPLNPYCADESALPTGGPSGRKLPVYRS